jgi:hypothetical protein
MAISKDSPGVEAERRVTPACNEAGVLTAARLIIELFGANAASYAAERAALLETKGDDFGAFAWRRVAPAIEELQQAGRPST